jgi:hypothetical protein
MSDWTEDEARDHEDWMARTAIEKLIKQEEELKAKFGSRCHDVIDAVADVLGAHNLCADCHHAKVNPFFHHEAPGTNWGAAIHTFRPIKST